MFNLLNFAQLGAEKTQGSLIAISVEWSLEKSFSVLGIELWTLHALDKGSTTELLCGSVHTYIKWE